LPDLLSGISNLPPPISSPSYRGRIGELSFPLPKGERMEVRGLFYQADSDLPDVFL